MPASSKMPILRLVDSATASRAESLWSRLAGSAGAPLTEKEAHSWIERWRKVTRSYGADLNRRLNWAGWTRDSILQRLTGVGSPLRDWPSAVNEWISRSLHGGGSRSAPAIEERFRESEHAVPFEELLQPLASQVAPCLDGPSVGPRGRNRMKRLSVQLLSDLAAPGLWREFARRTKGFGGYADFVAQPALVWRRLFSRRPVLSRLMVESSQRWRRSLEELLERLDKDRPLLRSRFNDGRPLGALQSLRKTGDDHLGGRAVYVLAFESGLQLVYKPRDLSPEAAWLGLIQWFNQRRLLEPFPMVGVLCRDGYGWMEHVAYDAIPNVAAARAYYRSAGYLIALIYALGGRDFHFENLIVSGGRPVPVDLETVMQPAFREDASPGDGRFPRGSVMETGLLPRWICPRPRRPVDLSGLGCVAPQTTGFWKLRFSNVNTGAMNARRTPWRVEPSSNVPRSGRRVFYPGDFSDAVQQGFQSAHRAIRALRDDLFTDRGPLQGFRDLRIRVLLRSSVSYWVTLQRSLQLASLTHGIGRSLAIERIAEKWLKGDDRPPLWPVAEAEIQALEKLDLPIFHSAARSRDLLLPTGRAVLGCFRRSAVENAERRLSRMSEQDMNRQLKLIESSLRRHRMARKEGRLLGPPLAWMLQNQEAQAARALDV